jgi:glycosyltransferase involved in cell wall biosynthesis
MDQPDAPPRVSVGLPVFNGEAYLAPAIESILGQTFPDLELIISDNASTDRTADICRSFADQDPRLRYFRQERNLGASPNYDFTFYQARGEYFKWAAHDDVIDPTMIERCVEVLDRYPDVQLAFPRTLRIDATGAVVGVYPDYSEMRLMSSRPSKRFGDIICKMHNCVAFFGLTRRAELATTLLHAAYEDADRHLLAQLALRGPLFEIPDHLFQRRDHAGAYSQSVALADRISWFDTSRERAVTFPEWHSIAVYLKLIRQSSLPVEEQRACRRQLVRWLFGPRWYRQRWVKLLRDGVFGGYRLGRKAIVERT